MTDAQTHDDQPAHHESDARTHKVEHDEHSAAKPQAKPKLNAVGLPEPQTGQPVDRHPHPERAHGERQDGAGAGVHRHDRHDAVPAGSTHAQRKGTDQGQPEEPDAAHRGQPALFKTGEASGSGASAGGARHGSPEEPATDSAGGAGREGRGRR